MGAVTAAMPAPPAPPLPPPLFVPEAVLCLMTESLMAAPVDDAAPATPPPAAAAPEELLLVADTELPLTVAPVRASPIAARTPRPPPSLVTWPPPVALAELPWVTPPFTACPSCELAWARPPPRTVAV